MSKEKWTLSDQTLTQRGSMLLTVSCTFDAILLILGGLHPLHTFFLCICMVLLLFYTDVLSRYCIVLHLHPIHTIVTLLYYLFIGKPSPYSPLRSQESGLQK